MEHELLIITSWIYWIMYLILIVILTTLIDFIDDNTCKHTYVCAYVYKKRKKINNQKLPICWKKKSNKEYEFANNNLVEMNIISISIIVQIYN